MSETKEGCLAGRRASNLRRMRCFGLATARGIVVLAVTVLTGADCADGPWCVEGHLRFRGVGRDGADGAGVDPEPLTGADPVDRHSADRGGGGGAGLLLPPSGETARVLPRFQLHTLSLQ